MSADLPSDNWQDLRLSRRTGHPNSGHYPALWEATADSTDTVTAQQLLTDGTLGGPERTFNMLEGESLTEGDRFILCRTLDGLVPLPIGTDQNPSTDFEITHAKAVSGCTLTAIASVNNDAGYVGRLAGGAAAGSFSWTVGGLEPNTDYLVGFSVITDESGAGSQNNSIEMTVGAVTITVNQNQGSAVTATGEDTITTNASGEFTFAGEHADPDSAPLIEHCYAGWPLAIWGYKV